MRSWFLLLLLFSLSVAQKITVSTELDKSSYSVGDTAIIALLIDIPDEHHLYANPLGPGVGKPLAVTPEDHDALNWVGALSDSSRKYQQDETNWVWQWDNRVNIFLKAEILENSSDTLNTSIIVDGLICKTACIPQYEEVDITIPMGKSDITSFQSSSELGGAFANTVSFPLAQKVVDSQDDADISFESLMTESNTWNYSPREASEVGANEKTTKPLNLGMAIVFAFIAGVILNFMPCVLPVLGIKILSFSEGRAGTKATAIKNSLAFAGGMILVFLLLGTFAAFAGMSWGEQFQNPVFTIVLIVLMFGFGLGLFDLFIILVPSKISEMEMKQDSHGIWGNFGKGIFATLLATPCSGPFLGATLAWTLTQPKIVIYAVFLALGVGMASPYILLAASERLSKMVPKPGAWMEDFKHILGFFLFGFAIYLMIGLPQELVIPTVAFLTVVAGAIIMYGRLAPFGVPLIRKLTALVVVLLLLGGGYWISFVAIKNSVSAQNSVSEWEPYSAQKLEDAHANGQNVVMDFTALWCMNCQFNKKTVYHTATMDSLIHAKDILAIKADLTNSNPELEALRTRLGSESVPFLVVFPADDPERPIVLRDIVTRNQVFSVLKKLP